MAAKRLERLHTWNGWNLLFLFVSGAILYWPALRGATAPIRVPLKYLHIASGLMSLVVLLQYSPLAAAHWQRLRQRIGQKANVILLSALLLGWGLTGVLLWFQRSLPPGWAETALLWHDRLTWFALPWALAHSVTRYWKLRLLPVNTPLREDRRVLLAGAAAVLGAVLWGRLGRALGLPGLASAPVAGDTNGSDHMPADGSTFTLPPIEPKPAEITERGRFRVYTVTDIPKFDARTWRFTVSGLVNQPLTLSWDEFTQLPGTTQLNDFHCVTGWSVINVLWEGAKLADLLDKAGVKPEARFVKFISGDGVYTDSLDLSTARLGDVMLTWAMDGSPLPTALGGPVRLIVPEMYGYKSVKWLQAIQLTATEHVGYWEERGYPADAWLNRS
jgi:DMSO/TMAO reductase YedYZ molybdopterin-dependent catalytic subunit